MRKLLVLSLIIATIAGFGFNKGPEYVFDGFRGIKWGTHKDSVFMDGEKVDFVPTKDVNGDNAYFIKNDDLMIGTVTLKNIYYNFNLNDRFNKVLMYGDKQFKEMLYILSYKWGDSPEVTKSPAGTTYRWVVDDVRVYLSRDGETENFTLEFSSNFELSEAKKINRTIDDF